VKRENNLYFTSIEIHMESDTLEDEWEDVSTEYLVAEVGSLETLAKDLYEAAQHHQGCDVVVRTAYKMMNGRV
jgi:hypothetical protein